MLKDGVIMEKQIINIRITTQGDVCEMTDEDIRKWYEENLASLFDEKYGTPQIEVDVERIEL